MEKDYSKSFPREWIWIQANHFGGQRACFMFSLARIPWLGSSFTGMICFLLTEGQLYRFATYNGAKLDRISLQDKTAAGGLFSGQSVNGGMELSAGAAQLMGPNGGGDIA